MKKKMPLDPAQVRSILAVNLGGIGDVLLSTPALRALKGRFHQARLTMLVVPRAAELARSLPFVDDVVEYPLNAALPGAGKLALLLVRLRSRRFDLALNMRTLVSRAGAFKIRLLLGALGARVNAGRNTCGWGRFFDVSIHEDLPGQQHEMDYDLDLSRALGCAVPDQVVHMDIPGVAERSAGDFLRRQGAGDGTLLIGLHPGGKPSHRWPQERFIALIDSLHRHVPEAVFVLTADAQEKQLTAAIAARAGGTVIDCAGRFSLAETAALIRRCRVYVTNDTANMHIAASLRVPLVALFGPGYVARFDPRRLDPLAAVMTVSSDCAPCDKSSCRTMDCLKGIAVKDVTDRVIALLRSPQKGNDV